MFHVKHKKREIYNVIFLKNYENARKSGEMDT